MIIPLALVAASIVDTEANQQACFPVASKNATPTPSAVGDHRVLRAALNEPMPEATSMVMLYGKGGHLATTEYSIVLAKTGDGEWRGTAVGRSQIWIQDAPYTPMKRVEWVLDKEEGARLNEAIASPCRSKPKQVAKGKVPEPPPRGLIGERIDVIRAGSEPLTFYSGEGGEGVSALIRPPKR